MRVVVDTNILVSAVLSPGGTSAQILNLILSRQITLLLSAMIAAEYEEVLKREKFSFNPEAIHELLHMMTAYAEKINTGTYSVKLPDVNDESFLVCALTGKADFLITGNKKHFPEQSCHPIKVLSPAEFLAKINPMQ